MPIVIKCLFALMPHFELVNIASVTLTESSRAMHLLVSYRLLFCAPTVLSYRRRYVSSVSPLTSTSTSPSPHFPPLLPSQTSRIFYTPVCTATRPSAPATSTRTSPPTPPSPPPSPFPFLLLNLVTILWGSQHALIKLSLSSLPPSTLLFLRFSLASLVSLPFLPSPSRNPRTYLLALEQSFYLFLGYGLQTIALQSTTAARSAFLLYLNVKFVPLLSSVLNPRPIPISVWTSAALALFGTLLLSYDGTPPNVGDLWSLAAAMASALFIVRLENAARYAVPAQLSAASLLFVAVFSGAWVAIDTGLGGEGVGDISSMAWAQVAYLGLVTTALSNWLQALAQKYVVAERAAVVYAMDPVYGAAFAAFLLGERLGPSGFIGAGCIVAAAIWSGKGLSSNPGETSESDSEEKYPGEVSDEDNV